MNSTSPQEVSARMKVSSERAFQAWMSKPETKLMMSMIPPADNPDALQTLLRSSFNEGHGNGQGEVAMLIVESMLKDIRPRSQG